jgi:hypothetical protein
VVAVADVAGPRGEQSSHLSSAELCRAAGGVGDRYRGRDGCCSTKRLQTRPEPRAWARRCGDRRNAKRLTVSSCHKPHSDAVDGADTRAGKWTADLHNDQGLVKATGGTAVPRARGRAGRGNERDPGSRRGRARRVRSDGWARAARRAAVHRRGGFRTLASNRIARMQVPELLALEFQAEVSCAS